MVKTRSVVNGQQLDDLHTRGYSPIDKPAQVTEVADTIALLRTQRKDGDTDSCRTLLFFTYPQSVTIKYQHLAFCQLGIGCRGLGGG